MVVEYWTHMLGLSKRDSTLQIIFNMHLTVPGELY